MRRRELLGVIGVAAAWPVVARAQQGTVIAILGTGAADSPSSKTQMKLLRAGMRELGLFEGKDYVFVARHFSGKTEHFRAPAFRAVRLLHDKSIARPRLNV